MDETWIVIAVLSIIGTVINIQLLNHNWFKRQELKSKYKVKEIRERSRAKVKYTPADNKNLPSSPIENIGGLLNIARGLEPEQLHEIVDSLTGVNTPESTGDMLEDLITNNPDLVKGFLDGLKKRGSNEQESHPRQT